MYICLTSWFTLKVEVITEEREAPSQSPREGDSLWEPPPRYDERGMEDVGQLAFSQKNGHVSGFLAWGTGFWMVLVFIAEKLMKSTQK